MQQSKQKQYIQLILVILVFIFPIIVGELLYLYRGHFQFKTTNHGTLINPPIVMKQKIFTEKTWKVLYVTPLGCNKSCHAIQHSLKQIKLALGKNSHRVRVIFSDAAIQSQLKLLLNKPHFIVTNKIYLIDPVGNLLMYYPEDIAPMAILKDLKHLLEVSQIG